MTVKLNCIPISLTATPDNRTYGFFKKNVVSDYSHEKAVADGVNVGNEIYVIETQITQQGVQIAAKQQVERREKLTRKKCWEQQDEDEAYSATQLDLNPTRYAPSSAPSATNCRRYSRDAKRCPRPVQKTEVAGTPETFARHVQQYQP